MATVVGKLLFSGVAILFGGFGVGIIKFARMMTEPVRAMEATETTDVADVDAGETVEVHGTVRPADEGTFESPLYGTTAVASVTRVQRYGGAESRGWYTHHEDQRGVPFVVDDGTGEIRVDPPDDATPTVESEWSEFGSGEEPSETVESYLVEAADVSTHSGLDLGPISTGPRRRCGEAVVEPGDDIRVFGEATRARTGLVVTGGDESFVYSTVDQAALSKGARRLRYGLSAFGALWIFISVVMAVVPWLAG